MKVKLEKDYRLNYTGAQAAAAKQLVKELRDMDGAEYWAEVIARNLRGNGHISGYFGKVVDAKAETCIDKTDVNNLDRFFVGSEWLNVWIDATIRTDVGFLEVGFLLTIAWDVTFTDDVAARINFCEYLPNK